MCVCVCIYIYIVDRRGGVGEADLGLTRRKKWHLIYRNICVASTAHNTPSGIAVTTPTRVAAQSPRVKPRMAYGMRAHGAASAAGIRSAMKLRLHGYTGGCKFSSCCRSTQNTREKWL